MTGIGDSTMPELLTVDDVADILGMHPYTVRRWCRDGDLRHVVLPGGRIRIHRTDLDALLRPSSPTP